MPTKKKRRYKPAAATICQLYAFMPNRPMTRSEFRLYMAPPYVTAKELPTFAKWANRLKLITINKGGKYTVTSKGARVAKRACR